MIIYTSADIYITSCKTLQSKLVAIDNVINALMDTMLKAAVNENFTEYILDDGQTKIQCNYRGVAGITQSIKALEALKNIYINMLNGRTVRLVDGKNFTRYNGYYGRY